MAYETGTATDHDDLLTKLIAFLTTAAGGLPTVQRWSLLADRAESGQRCVYLKGPGLAGEDNIFTQIRVKTDDPGIVYHWEMRGALGFDSDHTFETQVSVSNPYYVPLYKTSMPYHFFGNGRHFKFISVVEGAVYANGYAGFFYAYALPIKKEYPSPLFIGGNSYLPTERFDSVASSYRAFWQPGNDNNQKKGSCGLYFVSGEWLPFSDQDNTTEYGRIWPYYQNIMRMSKNDDDSQNVISTDIYTHKWDGVSLGFLDGVGYVSGHDMTPGDTVTDDGGEIWVCFNACGQVGIGNMVAFRKEI